MVQGRWVCCAVALLVACGGQSHSTPDTGSEGVVAGISGAATDLSGSAGHATDASMEHAGKGNGAAGGGAGGTVAFKPDHGCADDSACLAGSHCVEFTAGGIRYCTAPPGPLVVCDAPSGQNQCCSASQCPGGECLYSLSAPSGFCGNGGVSFYNACRHDECAGDQDCNPDQACSFAVAGASVRMCVQADCRVDADCAGGGACVWVQGGCCPGLGIGDGRLGKLACVYGDGCQSDADCGAQRFCVVKDGRARCDASCN